MVDQENDVADIDAEGADADFEKDAPVAAKPSLKEAWEGNPVMKIAALVLGGVVLVGGYMTFLGGGDDLPEQAVVGGTSASNVRATPGGQELDPEYKRALEEQDKQRVEEAMKTQGSALPSPIGSTGQTGLTVPEMPTTEQNDPLSAWRKEAESRRLALEQKVAEEEETEPVPEVVPMVQPVRPQQVLKANPELAKNLAAQMRVIITAQQPPEAKKEGVTKVDSEYTKMKDEEEKQQRDIAEGKAAGADDTGGEVPTKVIVPAGSILYAQLMNELNSDIPGPVLAQVVSGPFSGGRALGTLELKDEYLTLTFDKVIKDGVVYKVNAIALDETTTLAAHQTDVDHHYFSRVILPAAAEFIKGYASSVAETGTSTTTTSGGGVAQDTPEPSSTEEIYKGLEKAGEKVSEVLDESADQPVTVTVARGTTMGILFMDSVTTKSAGF